MGERASAVYDHAVMPNPHSAAHLEQSALSYGRGVVDETGAVTVTWFTPWGVTAAGQPYFDAAGAVSGEEARLRRTGNDFYLDTNIDL